MTSNPVAGIAATRARNNNCFFDMSRVSDEDKWRGLPELIGIVRHPIHVSQCYSPDFDRFADESRE